MGPIHRLQIQPAPIHSLHLVDLLQEGNDDLPRAIAEKYVDALLVAYAANLLWHAWRFKNATESQPRTKTWKPFQAAAPKILRTLANICSKHIAVTVCDRTKGLGLYFNICTLTYQTVSAGEHYIHYYIFAKNEPIIMLM